jgi:mono/diheme cytochrome c family protein
LLASAATTGFLGGCRGERSDSPPRQFLPDMDDSPKHKPQTESAFFEDGRSMRPRVQGAVAFGFSEHPDAPGREWHLRDDPAVFEGIDAAIDPAKNNNEPGYVATIPVAVFDRVIDERKKLTGESLDRAGAIDWLVRRGNERFNIYCSACHGYNGEGAGTLPDGTGYGGLAGRRWASPVPSFHDAKYLDRTQKTGRDGYVFNVIQHGVPAAVAGDPPKMPSYADKVNTRDAWAIVAYLRVLQTSWKAPTATAGAPSESTSLTTATEPRTGATEVIR